MHKVSFHKKAKKSEPGNIVDTVKPFKFWGFLNIGNIQFF